MTEVEKLSRRYGDKLAVEQARVRRPWARRAAVTATTGFIGISAFQLAIALGAPLGPAAYGGTYPAWLTLGTIVNLASPSEWETRKNATRC